MDLSSSFGVLRRQRILAITLLVLTLGGTAGAAVKLPWTYQAVGTTVLLNSKSAAAADDNNPLLAFSSSLASAAEVLSLSLMSPGTAQSLKARGYPDGYQVAISSLTGGPILQVTVTGSSKAEVEHTLHGVMGQVSNQLTALQPGVTTPNMITALTLSEAQQPSHSISKKAKPLVVVLGVGLVLTFAIPQAVDALAGRGRSRRRMGARSQETAYPAYDAPPGPGSLPRPEEPLPARPAVGADPSPPRQHRAPVTRGR